MSLDPPPYTPPPGWSGPTGGPGEPRSERVVRIWWVVGTVAAIVLLLAALAMGAGWYLFRGFEDHATGFEEPKRAADLDVPPSERGRGEAVDREIVPGAGREGISHQELRCAFTGQSNLDPGLPPDLIGGRPQRMTLTPGSSFQCEQDGEATAGTVEMDATFEELDIVSGVAEGTGRILWEVLPPEQAEGHGPAPLASSTTTEVELAFPEIIVWITIEEGPYEGFRGKLVLDRWELVKDADGTIVGVRFEPTDFRLSTI